MDVTVARDVDTLVPYRVTKVRAMGSSTQATCVFPLTVLVVHEPVPVPPICEVDVPVTELRVI